MHDWCYPPAGLHLRANLEQGGTMKLIAGKILSGIIAAGGWILFGGRLVLDLIGYSTVPEDLTVAATRLDQALGLFLSIPWWALLVFALISTLWLMWVSWPRTVHSADTTPAQKSPSPQSVVASLTDFDDTKLLFEVNIKPASNLMGALLNDFVVAVSKHPNKSVRSLIQVVQAGIRNPAGEALGRLGRALGGVDQAEGDRLQNLVGWYWNEYRLQKMTILEAYDLMVEAGIDYAKKPYFRDFLEEDKRFIEALRTYTGKPNRDAIRRAMESNGWDNQITRALNELVPRLA